MAIFSYSFHTMVTKSKVFQLLFYISASFLCFGTSQTPTTSPTINSLEAIPLSYDPLAQNWQYLSYGKNCN